MSSFTLTAQNVNGDPFIDGGNINITNGATTALIFDEVDDILGHPTGGEAVSLDGGLTYLSYEFLGGGDVRNDAAQTAVFIRVDMENGTYQTFAIDLSPGADGEPNLQNGNTKLTVLELDDTIEHDLSTPPCFVRGTLLRTARGLIPVEDVVEGDRVITRDNGFQQVLWTGARTVPARGDFAAIHFAKGVIGNNRALRVSPQHRILVSGWRAETYFGESEVLVAAKDMVNGDTVVQNRTNLVTYHHVLFESHQVILSEGAWTESFLPGDHILKSNPELRNELIGLFPELANMDSIPMCRSARLVLKGHEAQLLR